MDTRELAKHLMLRSYEQPSAAIHSYTSNIVLMRGASLRLSSQAAEIERLTRERDEARSRFNDIDLCQNAQAPCMWSLQLISQADSAEAEIERLREALARAQRGTPFSLPPEPVSKPSEEWVEEYAAWYDGAALTPKPNKEGE